MAAWNTPIVRSRWACCQGGQGGGGATMGPGKTGAPRGPGNGWLSIPTAAIGGGSVPWLAARVGGRSWGCGYTGGTSGGR